MFMGLSCQKLPSRREPLMAAGSTSVPLAWWTGGRRSIQRNLLDHGRVAVSRPLHLDRRGRLRKGGTAHSGCGLHDHRDGGFAGTHRGLGGTCRRLGDRHPTGMGAVPQAHGGLSYAAGAPAKTPPPPPGRRSACGRWWLGCYSWRSGHFLWRYVRYRFLDAPPRQEQRSPSRITRTTRDGCQGCRRFEGRRSRRHWRRRLLLVSAVFGHGVPGGVDFSACLDVYIFSSHPPCLLFHPWW
ncbi:unnamed protein product [Ectocarpus fasciculatus]